MKKKSPSIPTPAKAESQPRREYPYFCDVSAADATSSLNGMALRVIISDIRKHKTRDTRFGNPAVRQADKKTESE